MRMGRIRARAGLKIIVARPARTDPRAVSRETVLARSGSIPFAKQEVSGSSASSASFVHSSANLSQVSLLRASVAASARRRRRSADRRQAAGWLSGIVLGSSVTSWLAPNPRPSNIPESLAQSVTFRPRPLSNRLLGRLHHLSRRSLARSRHRQNRASAECTHCGAASVTLDLCLFFLGRRSGQGI
jgi:hypothetical protein